MEQWGDDLSSFDLILSLSPASQRRALELTRYFHLEVKYWPIMDPTGLGESRESQLRAYRQSRDQIISELTNGGDRRRQSRSLEGVFRAP